MNKSFVGQLFRFPTAVRRDSAIDAWTRDHPDELGEIAQSWFEVMRVRRHEAASKKGASRLQPQYI